MHASCSGYARLSRTGPGSMRSTGVLRRSMRRGRASILPARWVKRSVSWGWGDDAVDDAGTTPFRKILIVDDILYIVRSITRILEEAGYFVMTATTGQEALTKCRQFA